jgi:hypothetical protein
VLSLWGAVQVSLVAATKVGVLNSPHIVKSFYLSEEDYYG